MSPLYLYEGKLLIVDGKLAADENCCCGEGGCPCNFKVYPETWKIVNANGDFVFNEGSADNGILKDFPLNSWLPNAYPNPGKVLNIEIPTKLEIVCTCGIVVILESWTTNIVLCGGHNLRYPGYNFQSPIIRQGSNRTGRVFYCIDGIETEAAENDEFLDPNWELPDPPDPNCPNEIQVACCVVLGYEQEDLSMADFVHSFIGTEDFEWSNLANWAPNRITDPSPVIIGGQPVPKYKLPDSTRDIKVLAKLASNSSGSEPIVKNLEVLDGGSINIPITVLEHSLFSIFGFPFGHDVASLAGNIDQDAECEFTAAGVVTTKDATFEADSFNKGRLISENGTVIFQNTSECRNGSETVIRGSDLYFKGESRVRPNAVINIEEGPCNVYFEDNAIFEGTINCLDDGVNIYFSDDSVMDSGKIFGDVDLLEFNDNASVDNNSVIGDLIAGVGPDHIKFRGNSSINDDSNIDTAGLVMFYDTSSHNDDVTITAGNAQYVGNSTANDNACWPIIANKLIFGGGGLDGSSIPQPGHMAINNSTCVSNQLNEASFESPSENRGSLSVVGLSGGIYVRQLGTANFGTLSVTGGAELIFEFGSINEVGGTAVGNVMFDSATNKGEATSVGGLSVVFHNSSGPVIIAINETTGNVTGNALFSDDSINRGNVTGTATFEDIACNDGGTAGTFVPDPPPTC